LLFSRQLTTTKSLTSESADYVQKEIDDAQRSADEEITKRNVALKEYREKLAKLDADIHLAELMSGGGGGESAAAAAGQKDPLQAQLDNLMQAKTCSNNS
jgi:hypothetical protein